jgi:hypothetical protein
MLSRLISIEAAILWFPLLVVVLVKIIHPTEYLLVVVWIFLLVAIPMFVLIFLRFFVDRLAHKRWLPLPVFRTPFVLLGMAVWIWLLWS